ncbi:MAG: transcription termination factor NusA [Cetobacterium sp.]|uniref:transcription termination factor NusA n=1 Tax=unclassified Cetobacterium TaxID=2630983 RepID=UPI00163CBB2B|nr:transcription termination factor NusA [Cetobacterium sp. 2A]MBC2856487.1 transcription termination/antitermination protein NusA [Cetobacterium sp. 2A]
MKSKDAKIFLEALDELEREKGISKESLLEAVEQAMLAAYKKHYGEEENVEVEINRESGDVRVYEIKTVVSEEDLYDAALEISLEDAQEIKKRVKLGDIVKIDVNCEEFRRNAIQNGKQIVIQKVREAERQNIYDKFKNREKDIINGIIRRIDDKKNIFIEFDGIEAILPIAEQSAADVYRVGERIKVYVVEVEKTSKFPKIVISRKNEGLLKKLFELEIPEISEGVIEIKAVAREAGSRAKVAVFSNDDNIDTVGACIGQKGLRIRNIVNELNGEKIDIVVWKDSIQEFVSAVLSPAKVKSVEVLEEGATARVMVESSQLSLAIGKNGQNARLAAKLTGMRVDIKTDDTVEPPIDLEITIDEGYNG